MNGLPNSVRISEFHDSLNKGFFRSLSGIIDNSVAHLGLEKKFNGYYPDQKG